MVDGIVDDSLMPPRAPLGFYYIHNFYTSKMHGKVRALGDIRMNKKIRPKTFVTY